MLKRLVLVSVAGLALLAGPALAQGTCPNRGQLDALYCDANDDLVADAPSDPKKLRDPSTIVFTYTPVEDPAVYENIFKPFTTISADARARRWCSTRCSRTAAEIEAMRSGRLHVAGFSTGPTGFAVNLAGAVPFAVKGTAERFQGYNLIVIVKKRQPLPEARRSQGQEGRAHRRRRRTRATSRRSRCSPSRASRPDKDYKIIFSGKHDQSVLGVKSGDYDAGAGRLRRVPSHGRARPDQGRRLPHHLPQPEIPDLVVRLRARSRAEARGEDAEQCFYDYRFPPRDAEGVRRRRPLLPDQLPEGLGGRAQGRRRIPDTPSTRPPTRKKRRARPRRRARRPRDRRSNDGRDGGRRGDMRRSSARARVIRSCARSTGRGKPVLQRHRSRHRRRAASPRSSARPAPASPR